MQQLSRKGSISRTFRQSSRTPSGINVQVAFEYSFIPAGSGKNYLVSRLRFGRSEIVQKFPVLSMHLERLFDGEMPLVPKPDIYRIINDPSIPSGEKISGKNEKEGLIDLLDEKIEEFWSSTHGIGIIRSKSRYLVPIEHLAWRAERFCRKYRRFDNFHLLLGAWIEGNRKEEKRAEAFAELFSKWCPPGPLKEMIPAVPTGFLRRKSVAETVGVTPNAAFFALSIVLGVFSFSVMNKYSIPSKASSYIAARLKDPKIERNEEMNEIDRIAYNIKFSPEPEVINAGIMRWIELAEKYKVKVLPLIDPGKDETKELESRLSQHSPTLFHVSHKYLQRYFRLLDEEIRSLIKHVKWIVFTPNGITVGRNGRGFDFINGLEYGRLGGESGGNLILVSTADTAGNAIEPEELAATFSHEIAHAGSRHRIMTRLENEMNAFKASVRTLNNMIVSIEKKLSDAVGLLSFEKRKLNGKKQNFGILLRIRQLEREAEEIRIKIIKLTAIRDERQSRVRWAEYLAALGGGFFRIYPPSRFTVRELIEAGIVEEFQLTPLLELDRGIPEFDSQIRQAAKELLMSRKEVLSRR